MNSPKQTPEKQPNPPVEKQSRPTPEMRPRKPHDGDFEREGKFQRPAGPGTVPAGSSPDSKR